MKTILIFIVAALSLSACNSNGNKSAEATSKNRDSTQKGVQSSTTVTSNEIGISGMVNAYLQLKNALANDNSKEAAAAGTEVQKAFGDTNPDNFSAEQKKVFAEVKEDAIEHAEHIADNANNIEHQREHFEILSDDFYDLVKVFGANQTLYQIHCPMYNNNKGANWLSETKEIRNPYLGSKMPTCGEVKEEIN